MCRWFAYISNTEECLLEDVLIVPAHSISKQVDDHYLPYLSHYEPDDNKADTKKEIKLRNFYHNSDGLGVAWYSTARAKYGEGDGPQPALYKELRHPQLDPSYKSICANTSTLAVFAHIRAASPGSAITEYNCHPFQFGRWTFMHNGGVSHFDEIKTTVATQFSRGARGFVMGTSDSEHLAALFFTCLERARGPRAWDTTHPLTEIKRALEEAITRIIDIQKQAVAQTGEPFEPSSLNVAVTDGTQLLAIRFRNHPTEHPPSLYLSTTAGVTLNRNYPGHPDGKEFDGGNAVKKSHEHGDHVIVASEPTTYKKEEWELIRKNECVMVDTSMALTRAPLEISF